MFLLWILHILLQSCNSRGQGLQWWRCLTKLVTGGEGELDQLCVPATSWTRWLKQWCGSSFFLPQAVASTHLWTTDFMFRHSCAWILIYVCFVRLKSQHGWGLVYWWTPDDSFLELDPSKVVYPPYNAYEWLTQKIYTSAGKDSVLAKLISPHLEFLAPDIVKLMENSLFDIDSVNLMMKHLNSMADSRTEQACSWLKDNEARWRAWIPDATECSRGSGLYNETLQSFVEEKEVANVCRVCLPGTYSLPITDDSGATITYRCVACPAGQHQPAAAAVTCELCPVGTFKAFQSAGTCMPCPSGFYEDEKGSVKCKQCPEKTTTVLVGVTKPSDCVCVAGTIDVRDASANSLPKECAACLEGLSCPDGSTIQLLTLRREGENTTVKPEVLSGCLADIGSSEWFFLQNDHSCCAWFVMVGPLQL